MITIGNIVLVPHLLHRLNIRETSRGATEATLLKLKKATRMVTGAAGWTREHPRTSAMSTRGLHPSHQVHYSVKRQCARNGILITPHPRNCPPVFTVFHALFIGFWRIRSSRDVLGRGGRRWFSIPGKTGERCKRGCI